MQLSKPESEQQCSPSSKQTIKLKEKKTDLHFSRTLGVKNATPSISLSS